MKYIATLFFMLIATMSTASAQQTPLSQLLDMENGQCLRSLKRCEGRPLLNAAVQARQSCGEFRLCKRSCRQEKRSCKQSCNGKKGKAKRQCKRRCRKARRACKQDCRQANKPACKQARRAVYSAALQCASQVGQSCVKDLGKAILPGN